MPLPPDPGWALRPGAAPALVALCAAHAHLDREVDRAQAAHALGLGVDALEKRMRRGGGWPAGVGGSFGRQRRWWLPDLVVVARAWSSAG